MIYKEYVIFFLGFVLISCGQATYKAEDTAFQDKPDTSIQVIHEPSNGIHEEGTTIQKRILTPKGFSRITVQKNSFAYYLRTLPLKPHGAEVLSYNGTIKGNDQTYIAVVDKPIGNKDLHQCADAVMRLYAEHMFEQKQYEKIHFNFTNGFRVDYSKWMNGNRVIVDGNKTWWTLSADPSNTYESWWKYMELIFTYAGTLSLAKELKPVAIEEMQIGDIFIHGGSPGHAVIVVDMCIDASNGEKRFLLAQSFMPAQDIQVLHNRANKETDPWYPINFGDVLDTPEWVFYAGELKRFGQ